MEKIRVSREQTEIASNIASSWCMVMYSSNPGVDQGPVWGPSSYAYESFPVLVIGRRWSFLTKEKRST